MKINHQTTIGTDAWRAEFSLAEETLMRFYLGERKMLDLRPVQINKQSEAQSLPQKTRIHRKIDGLSLSYDVSNLIPFGAEPKIDRNFDFTDGFARVVQDINPGKLSAAEKLTVDTMSLPGPWRRIAIVRIPGAEKTFPALEWVELHEGACEVLFDEPYPFLAVILEAPDGKCFEIGSGDDLWRWQAAADLPACSAEFSVCGHKDAVEIIRTPVLFDTEAEDAPKIERRTWRFKWYFAWSEAPAKKAASGRAQITIDTADFVEKNDKYPCMHAASSGKQLRQTLRGIIASNRDSDIVLINSQLHVCAQENHLDRGSRKNFLHWDAWDFMELFIWANRQALTTGCTFRIDGNGATPLMRRLAGTDFKLIRGE